MNLTAYSLRRLLTLQKNITRAIEKKRALDRQRVLKKLRKLARREGYALDELLGRGAGGRRAAPAHTVAAKYRHPENATLTWSGRGRPPAWIVEWKKKHKNLDALKVS